MTVGFLILILLNGLVFLLQGEKKTAICILDPFESRMGRRGSSNAWKEQRPPGPGGIPSTSSKACPETASVSTQNATAWHIWVGRRNKCSRWIMCPPTFMFCGSKNSVHAVLLRADNVPFSPKIQPETLGTGPSTRGLAVPLCSCLQMGMQTATSQASFSLKAQILPKKCTMGAPASRTVISVS